MKRLLLIVTAGVLLAACNNETKSADNGEKKESSMTSATSQAEKNKQVMMGAYASMNAHKPDEMVNPSNTAADIVEYGDGSTAPVKGIDSVRAGIAGWLNAFPDYKGENLQYIADGDMVVVLGDYSGTFKNDFAGMKATGKSFKVKDADIFTLKDGKVTSHRSVQSMATQLMQLGVPMK